MPLQTACDARVDGSQVSCAVGAGSSTFCSAVDTHTPTRTPQGLHDMDSTPPMIRRHTQHGSSTHCVQCTAYCCRSKTLVSLTRKVQRARERVGTSGRNGESPRLPTLPCGLAKNQLCGHVLLLVLFGVMCAVCTGCSPVSACLQCSREDGLFLGSLFSLLIMPHHLLVSHVTHSPLVGARMTLYRMRAPYQFSVHKGEKS
jgi:hypothetical protein